MAFGKSEKKRKVPDSDDLPVIPKISSIKKKSNLKMSVETVQDQSPILPPTKIIYYSNPIQNTLASGLGELKVPSSDDIPVILKDNI